MSQRTLSHSTLHHKMLTNHTRRRLAPLWRGASRCVLPCAVVRHTHSRSHQLRRRESSSYICWLCYTLEQLSSSEFAYQLKVGSDDDERERWKQGIQVNRLSIGRGRIEEWKNPATH